MKFAIPLAIALAAALPGVGHAADAAHPYSNIDRRNDAGNNTGDWEVDRLNQAQLSRGAPRYARGWGGPVALPPVEYRLQPVYPRAYYPRPAYRPYYGYPY